MNFATTNWQERTEGTHWNCVHQKMTTGHSNRSGHLRDSTLYFSVSFLHVDPKFGFLWSFSSHFSFSFELKMIRGGTCVQYHRRKAMGKEHTRRIIKIMTFWCDCTPDYVSRDWSDHCPGVQRFLALGELGPKSRAAGGWGEASPPAPRRPWFDLILRATNLLKPGYLITRETKR